jgi:hypothetical protein
MTETTIQEDMAAAISELEAKGATTTEAVDKLEPSTQERGDDGKFKPKEEKVAAKDEDEGTPPPAETPKVEAKEPVQAPLGGDPDTTKRELLAEDRAPSGWTPKAREEWAKLPEVARQEILRREEDSVKGVRQLQEQMAPYTQFAQTLEPFIKEAFDNKADPGQYIGNVMQAERRLRTGTPDQRFSALVEIAEGYGIPLRKVINDALGQEVIPHPALAQPAQSAIPPEIQRELEEARQFRQNYQQTQQEASGNANAKLIEDFKKDKEFFEDVRDDMGILFETGRTTDLQTAYDIACRMNPAVYQVITERAAKPALNDKQKAAAKLKGTSSNSAETSNADFDDDDDLATTVRKAAAQASGRI